MLPRLVRIRQKVPAESISDLNKEIDDSFAKIGIDLTSLKGLKVGITAGSRGINAYPKILQIIVERIKKAQGYPIIIPSMGSHGGGTVEGQLRVLESLGITEESVGAPIAKCVDSIKIGETDLGVSVYCNVEATKVDRLIIVNRIKAHTDFEGQIESGLCKMMAIGLGSAKGCVQVHSHALIAGYEEVITSVAKFMMEKLPIFLGVAILENWKGETAEIKAILPENLIEEEKKLLAKVKTKTIKLPIKNIDVLVVGEMGKNISGTGMDTKVIGRIMVLGQKEPEFPKIKRIVVLNLTPQSHGNAIGIGLADITTEKVFNSINIRDTSLNSISSMCLEQGRLPCIVANDKEAIKSAILTSGVLNYKDVRLVYIQNTLNLENLAVSESLFEEVAMNDQLEITGELEELKFDENGFLLNFQGGKI